VRAGQRQHLCAFPLGEPTPDSVGFVDLERMGPAGGHRRTFEAHRFRLRLPPCSRRSAFTLRVEEERAGHATAGRVQLPVPQIGIRAGKAPGVRHFDPLGGDQNPNSPPGPGIWARSTPRSNENGVTVMGMTVTAQVSSPCSGRIRADPGAVDLQTLERFSSLDKTLITFFVDLDQDGSGTDPGPAADQVCVVAHMTDRAQIGGGRSRHESGRLLSVLRVEANRRFCPRNSFLGPYCRSTGVNVFRHHPASSSAGSLLLVRFSEASTPSAGGVT